MKLKEFLKKWCEPNTDDESVIYQFNEDLYKLEFQMESEQEYNEGEYENFGEKAKQQMEETLEAEEEFLNQGDENV